jgi:uncharacterized integral membrane protein
MTKFKTVMLLIFGAALAIFIVQNWQYPNPPLHFLGFQLLPFPQPAIILGFFLAGFLAGWLACLLRGKKLRQEELPEPPQGN